jgi:hypothetical protein
MANQQPRGSAMANAVSMIGQWAEYTIDGWAFGGEIVEIGYDFGGEWVTIQHDNGKVVKVYRDKIRIFS